MELPIWCALGSDVRDEGECQVFDAPFNTNQAGNLAFLHSAFHVLRGQREFEGLRSENTSERRASNTWASMRTSEYFEIRMRALHTHPSS